MEQIYIERQGQVGGPYNVETARQYVSGGQLSGNDKARFGESGPWATLAQLLGGAAQPAPASMPRPDATASAAPAASAADSSRTALLVAYVLFALGAFVPLLALIGLVICFVKRGDLSGSYLQTHCSHLLRTAGWSFGLGLVLAILYFVTMLLAVATFGLGAIIMIPLGLVGFGVWLWYGYRVVKGLIAFSDRRPV